MREDPITGGLAALEAKDWTTARLLLGQAVAEDPDSAMPDVLDGLADAYWWCGEVSEALATREKAVGAWRASGELDRAVRGAVWTAIEYADALGHDAASRGWFARASTMADSAGTVAASGWVALGHAAVTDDPAEQAESAQQALDVARAAGDDELEVLALARLGWARVASGAVDAGIAVFDEAMATATAADYQHPTALGDLCCQLARATEAAGVGGQSRAGSPSCGASTPRTATRLSLRSARRAAPRCNRSTATGRAPSNTSSRHRSTRRHRPSGAVRSSHREAR